MPHLTPCRKVGRTGLAPGTALVSIAHLVTHGNGNGPKNWAFWHFAPSQRPFAAPYVGSSARSTNPGNLYSRQHLRVSSHEYSRARLKIDHMRHAALSLLLAALTIVGPVAQSPSLAPF